jgi:hypothetical protein
MLKFLVFALLVAAVVAFFALRQTPKRPPRDWRHGGDDGGPVPPTVHIGLDTGRKPANDATPGGKPEPATTDSGGDGGD